MKNLSRGRLSPIGLKQLIAEQIEALQSWPSYPTRIVILER